MIQVYAYDQTYVWDGTIWVGRMGRPCPEERKAHVADLFLDKFFEEHGCDWQVLSSRWIVAGMNICQQASLRMLGDAALSRIQRKDDVRALTLLCHCARNSGKPEIALDLAQRNVHLDDPELLTCQAAALCDLGRWREADWFVQRALQRGSNQPAKQVRFRILAYRAAAGKL